MSLLRHMLQSASRCVVCIAQPAVHLSKRSHEAPKLDKCHVSYRYMVRDKSKWDSFFAVEPNLHKNIAENKYVLRKANMEKKKCFEQIESIQKRWGPVKRRNNIIPQTTYDQERPNLWMRVKDMYDTSNFFVRPKSVYRFA